MKFNKEVPVAPKPMDKWEKKDKDIQIAQAVNLAVAELSVIHKNTDAIGFPEESIKNFAKKYNKILTELKNE